MANGDLPASGPVRSSRTFCLAAEDRERIRRVVRRHDHLDELAFDDRGRGRRVDAAVEGDDAAEGRSRIGFVGGEIGVLASTRRAPRRRDSRA